MTPTIQRKEGLYQGALAAAIPSVGGGLLAASLQEIERILHATRQQKMPALFAHFGIDPKASDAWEQLAYSLARRHVPGFQEMLPVPSINIGPCRSIGLPWLSARPPKRRRGRPPKLREYGVSGSGGLLDALHSTAKRRPGRPEQFTRKEKCQLVAAFDDEKARLGVTDELAAVAFIKSKRPTLNAYNTRTLAKQIVRWVRRLRAEIGRFDNL